MDLHKSTQLNAVSRIRKYLTSLIILLVMQMPLIAIAQTMTTESASILVKEEKEIFRNYINWVNVDSNIINRLSRFVIIEADSIQKVILDNKRLTEEEKIRGIRSIVFMMKGLREKIEMQKLETYDIPGVLESYKKFLHSMLNKTGYEDVLQPLGVQRSQMLANTFWQCDECSMLNDIVVYKRLASAPDYILQNLEKNPHFYFRDSLLILAVMNNPSKVADYLARSKSGLTDIIRRSNNKYVQYVVKLSGNKDAEDLLPFTEQLVDGKITAEEIMKERSDVTRYFQLLVNTLKTKLADNSLNGFQYALRRAIEQKALAFYIRPVNEDHDAADNIRFAAVKGLRAEDLYYIIISSGEDLYTSSYLGLYNRMMTHFKNPQADSLFKLVQNDQFPKFIQLAANYNVLNDFLKHMPEASAKNILHRFIGGIENDTQTGLEKAMNVADLFTAVASSREISAWIKDELQANYVRTKNAQQYFGARLYDILLQVYDLVMTNDPNHKLWATLGNYQMLKNNALKNKKGEIVEMVLFYGDKDGIASYNSFLNLFKDAKLWEVSKNEQWATIRSLKGDQVVIYANLPLDNEENKDLEAQDALSAYLKKQTIEPTILIHRGHSYHLEHTFKQLQPSMKLVLLGSCGGYNNNLSIANFSPDAQIIVSKKVGSKSINDPMIEVINQSLLDGKDLHWSKVWEDIAGGIKDQSVKNLFSEYIPPAKNVNIFVLKLFNYSEPTKMSAVTN